ncbi:MAG: hypothetical protein ACYTHM_10870 [Planctomycetota bacterium]
MFFDRTEDGPALEAMKDLVMGRLQGWTDGEIGVVRVDADGMPLQRDD